jgi:ABC-type nickel/cobalt efflux system permease component RcnA
LWVRQESFWRDVATRTSAILISGLILYLGALILGYVTAPSAKPFLKLGATIIIAVTGLYLPVKYMEKRYRRQLDRGEPILAHNGWVSFLASVAWIFLLIGGVALVNAWH